MQPTSTHLSSPSKTPSLKHKHSRPKPKQQSLTHLINLLQHKKQSLPPATIQQYIQVEQAPKQDDDQVQQKIRIKPNDDSMHKSYLFLPKVAQVASIARKKKIESSKDEHMKVRIDKLIDEYVKQIEENNILDNCEDHSALIRQAVIDIRQKVIEQMKPQPQESVLPTPKNKFIKFPISSRQTLQPIHNPDITSPKSLSKTVLPDPHKPKHHKKVASTIQHISSPQNNDKLLTRQKSQQKLHAIEQMKRRLHKGYLPRSSFNEVEQKNRITAHMNLYRLDMDRINKNTQMREKERRRSQKSFISKLNKESFCA